MSFIFEDLNVYQKAVDLADKVHTLTEEFPRNNHHLADQLNRAAVSISLNIAEGNGRFTKADRKYFFGVARGSTHECVPLIELCRRRHLVPDEHARSMRNDLEQIAKMIAGLITGLDRRNSP